MADLAGKEEESALDLGVRTASTASFVLASKVVSFSFGAAAIIIIARILGPSIYGIYVLAAAVAGLFGSVGNFGIATAFNKFSSEYRVKHEPQKLNELVSNGHAILLIAGTSLMLIAIAASAPIASYSLHNPSDAYILQAISVSILAAMMMGAGYSVLIGIGKGAHAAVVSVVSSVLQALVGVSLALYGFGALAPVLGLVASQVVGYITAIALITLKDGVSIVAPTLAGMRRLLSFSVPIALSNVFSAVVNNASLLVLGVFATTFIMGNFGIASNTNYLFDIVLGSISVSLLPTFSATLANRRIRARIGEFFSYSLYMAFLLVAPLIFFIAVLAKPVSYVAFSGVYTLAPLYIRIMAVGLLIGLAGSYASMLLISANEVRKVLKYNAITALVQLAFLFVLVPEFKGVGLVTLLYIVTPVTASALFVSSIVRRFRVHLDMSKLGRIMASNLVSIAPALPLSLFWGGQYIPLLVTSAIAFLALYPVLLVLFGAVTTRDIERIRTVSMNIPLVGKILRLLLSYAELAL